MHMPKPNPSATAKTVMGSQLPAIERAAIPRPSPASALTSSHFGSTRVPSQPPRVRDSALTAPPAPSTHAAVNLDTPSFPICETAQLFAVSPHNSAAVIAVAIIQKCHVLTASRHYQSAVAY